ncbi:MAG: sialate O-acetylesterase, partial [Bacteroidota bacterium]
RAIADPLIRELAVNKSFANTPRERLEIDPAYGPNWMTGTTDEIGKFSGVGSYFAHYLREEVDVPIGLLHASWGGSRIEPWMNPEALGMDPADLRADREDAMAAVGAEGKANFAKYFPGRELPTKDEGETLGWLREDFDDTVWPTMTLPTHWEAAGYPSVDGHFYFRRTFTLTAEQAAGTATLSLGAIDDGDWTYVNGQEVGSTPNAYSEAREYVIDPGVLRAGENVLAIRVYDNWGGGGFSASPGQFYLKTTSGEVSLSGDFRYNIGEFRVEARLNQLPTILYNAMIAPLKGYPLSGVLWYQGESNAGQGDNVAYADLMKSLIRQWRGFFAREDLPFYWVQLANFQSPPETPDEPGWAVLRQSQTAALDLPLTGQAVITDIGEADDIHPRNKWEVGRRLSLHALKDIYDKKVQAASPRAVSAKKMLDHVLVEFSDIGGGLNVKTPGRYSYLKGFTVQDASGEWHFAQAILDVKQNTVKVFNPAGTGLQTVRYAWANNPVDANLFS